MKLRLLCLCLMIFAHPCLHAHQKKDSLHFIRSGNDLYQCSIGRSGVVSNKKEGDGATPLGSFRIRKIYYRPDRINPAEFKTNLPLNPLTINDAWCDDVRSNQYNQFVKLPFRYSHENLWREDHVYDIIAVLGYNDYPIVKGKGSAIFLHIAREHYSPTAGCISLAKNNLLKLISQLSIHDEIRTSLSGNVMVIKLRVKMEHDQVKSHSL